MGDGIAQWPRLQFPPSRPGFESLLEKEPPTHNSVTQPKTNKVDIFALPRVIENNLKDSDFKTCIFPAKLFRIEFTKI